MRTITKKIRLESLAGIRNQEMEFASLVNWVFSVLLRFKANWDTGFWKTIQPNKQMDLSPFSIPKIEATKTTHGRACALSKICRILFSSFYPLFSSVFFISVGKVVKETLQNVRVRQASRIKANVSLLSDLHSSILYFPIAHNTLCLPPKFCINHCF